MQGTRPQTLRLHKIVESAVKERCCRSLALVNGGPLWLHMEGVKGRQDELSLWHVLHHAADGLCEGRTLRVSTNEQVCRVRVREAPRPRAVAA